MEIKRIQIDKWSRSLDPFQLKEEKEKVHLLDPVT